MRRKFGKNLCALSLCSLSMVLMCSCQDSKSVAVEDKEFLSQSFLDLTKGEINPLVMAPSDGYSNGGSFGCTWSSDCVSFDEEGMHLSIYKDDTATYGAEMKTIGGDGFFSCGYFKTTMKPSDVAGTASTFFLYTGESDGNSHDEIDIEFLGKDTTKVQFNYFKDGKGGHEYMYDLGFDASEEFHDYGFYWDLGKIIWYVDDKPVYELVGDMPSHDMRLFTNFWCGEQSKKDIVAWMGALNDADLPATATYKNIYYSDLDGRGITVPGKAEESTNYISLMDHSFGGSYEVTKNGNAYDVNWTQGSGAFRDLTVGGLDTLSLTKPKSSLIKLKNLNDYSYAVTFTFQATDKGYATTGGRLKKSENGSSSYSKHGSTAEYFTLGANDTAEFEVTLNSDITEYRKIEIICEPKAVEDLSGSFSILDWTIAE